MVKKKILHLVESFGGGVYNIVKAIAEGSCEEFDVTIAFAWRPQTPPGFKEEMNPRVHLLELKNFEREINLVKDCKAFVETKEIIKIMKPDIVHLHSSKAGILGRMAIDCKKIPVLYTPHGYSFEKKDENKWKRYFYRSLEKWAAKQGGMTVACSEGEKRIAEEITKRVIFINNGINISQCPVPKAREFHEKSFRICTIGRICAQKNPTSFNELAKAFPEYTFTWIGDGELRECLTEPNISITGWQLPEKTLELLNENDIFVLPSLWEGLAVSLLEAMYLKCVCVASNIPGTKEVILHEKNGFLFNNIQECIAVIHKIIDNKYPIKEITEQAHRDVKAHYTVENMNRCYTKLYRDIGDRV